MAVLVSGVNPRRALDPRHLEFFRLVARQIANAMANALAHEESRHRAEALAEIDRAKTAFFSNVSHEFRTPLTLMLGPLQDIIERSTEVTGEDRRRVEVAQRNAMRLLKLVNSLLDFSRIEAGRVQASYEPTDLASFTAELASVFRSAIERAGLRLVVNCDPMPEPVFVDREMWEKIVLNLLSNALKFTFTGEIEIGLHQRDRSVELVVRDTGTGIPADELPHVFERFHRVRNARSRSFEGTGIGLALVQELAALHGGSVRVQSALERGSTFVVTIPLGSSHLPADRILAPRPDASTAVAGTAYVEEALRWLPDATSALSREAARKEARIVVADDNSDMLDYVHRLLVDRYDVIAVRDGVEALQAIRAQRPDLVLSDVMMPGLDGFALLAAVRQDPAIRKLPFILLSARAGEDARLEGLRAGADEYLVKPFSANELVARVASTLQLSRLHREGEEQLAQLNRQLRRRVAEQETLLDVLPIGIGIAHDRECRDIRINRAFAAVLGLRPDANASKTAPPGERPTNFRVVAPDGVEMPDDQLPLQVAAREGIEVGGVQFDVVHDDGRVVRLLEYAAPLFDEQGMPAGAVGAFVDVTASHHAQQQLARSEERHRRIFETAGVSIWEEDFSEVKRALDALRAEGVDDIETYLHDHPEFVDHCISLVRIVDVNPASLRMFAAADKQALMGSLNTVFANETRAVFAHELVAMARGDRQFETETSLRALDGRTIHALMTITLPAPNEPCDSVLVSLADITDRKQMENALRRSETLFRDMADTAPVMLWMADAAGQCTFLSRSWYEFTGQTEETGLGLGWIDAVHPDDRARAEAVFLSANGRREPFRLEYRLRQTTGEYRWTIDAARPRVDADGRFAGFIGAVFDINERKEAEEILQRLYRDVEQANRVKDEFLATLSHELRTPLNAVLGWAHMLRQGSMPAAMQQRALESLERNAKAQAQLVEELLDVSRIMSGKLHIKADEVDLATTISNAIESVRPAASAKRLHLHVHIEEQQRLLVTGDSDRLQQIVWNLVSNAIKFTPSGGRVDVDLQRVDSRAEIVVRDTGEGIAPAFRPHLFERFRQMDASIARRHGGLGLGLSIVRHLTEAHGGTVSAESEGEGQGATFRVSLPLRAVRERATTADDPDRQQSTRALAGVRVLVVDDEPDARELIRYVLESRGAQVMAATSAGEALHFVDGHVFDVLIADIGMPEQDGYWLIRVLRELPAKRARTLPSIALTAYAGVRERDKALDAGYNWHLAKPVDPDQLVATVVSAVTARSA
jgi:PAS domain S-box-containing protein